MKNLFTYLLLLPAILLASCTKLSTVQPERHYMYDGVIVVHNYETEGGPFDDSPGLELKKANRIYNKKLRALKEKYNIKDGRTNADK